MRELIYKNLMAPSSKKRDVSLEEVVEKNGFVSSTKKRSIYFVLEAAEVKSKTELEEWVEKRKKDPLLNRKFFHILRRLSSKEKEDKLICKMRGTFYLLVEKIVYHVVFVHILRTRIFKTEATKCT